MPYRVVVRGSSSVNSFEFFVSNVLYFLLLLFFVLRCFVFILYLLSFLVNRKQNQHDLRKLIISKHLKAFGNGAKQQR